MCLIPKKENSIKIKEYRPISLTTSLYKVIAKVLANWVKEIIASTVDDHQSAFIEGSQILDPILIANEVVEEYRSSGKEGLVFKIDFENTYDHVDWEFLVFVLWKKGFGDRWRKWIKGCLQSTNFSILINGRPRGKFTASRGLGQGDSLSPFLFNLVVDGLGRIIDRAREVSLVKGLEVGKDKVEITHLQFADDTILFLRADEENLRGITRVLKIFSGISGLKINADKSSLIGINLDQVTVESWAAVIGCSKEEWLINYLGVPLGGNQLKISFWEPVIAKITK